MVIHLPYHQLVVAQQQEHQLEAIRMPQHLVVVEREKHQQLILKFLQQVAEPRLVDYHQVEPSQLVSLPCPHSHHQVHPFHPSLAVTFHPSNRPWGHIATDITSADYQK